MVTSQSVQGPVGISDWKWEKRDGYSTGTATYSDPQGLGQFTIRVSGQEDSIHLYATQMHIRKLQVAQAPTNSRELMDSHHLSALDYKRKWWYAQLDALRGIIQSADWPLLNDPDALWRRRPGVGVEGLDYTYKLDLKRDRLIEIEPRIESREKATYLVSLDIDPPLSSGHLDVYMPVGTVPTVWARTDQVQGDPNLFLWLYYAGQSNNPPVFGGCSGWGPGQPDEVENDANLFLPPGGFWRLHVYAASGMDCTYTLYGNWVYEVRV